MILKLLSVTYNIILRSTNYYVYVKLGSRKFSLTIKFDEDPSKWDQIIKYSKLFVHYYYI